MISCKTIVIVLAIIIIVSGAGFSQVPAADSSTQLTIDKIKERVKVKGNFSDFTNYDEFKDVSTVGYEHRRLKSIAGGGLVNLSIFIAFSGKILKEEPKFAYLKFSTTRLSSTSWGYLKDQHLIFLCGEKRITPEFQDYSGKAGPRMPLGGSSLNEYMLFTLPFADLRTLADCKEMKFQLGFNEGELRDENQNDIKLLLDFLKP